MHRELLLRPLATVALGATTCRCPPYTSCYRPCAASEARGGAEVARGATGAARCAASGVAVIGRVALKATFVASFIGVDLAFFALLNCAFDLTSVFAPKVNGLCKTLLTLAKVIFNNLISNKELFISYVISMYVNHMPPIKRLYETEIIIFILPQNLPK